jgi:hypothetical protein
MRDAEAATELMSTGCMGRSHKQGTCLRRPRRYVIFKGTKTWEMFWSDQEERFNEAYML